jgi:hypothetical protein
MTTVTKKLYLDSDGTWKTSLDQSGEQDIEAFLNSIDYDADLKDLLADQGNTSTDEEYSNSLDSAYFSSPSFVRPLLKSELSRYPTKQNLLDNMLSDLKELQQIRNSQVARDPNNTTIFANMPLLAQSSVSPGLKTFRVSNMAHTTPSFEAADDTLEASLAAIKSIFRQFNNTASDPISARLVRLSKPRSDLDAGITYPGDLVRLVASGGSGLPTFTTPRMSRINPLLDIFKVISAVTGQSQNTVTDALGNNVTVNINIQLPANYSQSGTDEEL